MLVKNQPAEIHSTTSFQDGVLNIREVIHDTVGPSSVTVIDLDGDNRLIVNLECTARYFVLGGHGSFRIEKSRGKLETYMVKSGDLVVIPPGVAFQDSGRMKLVAVYTPSFDSKQVKALSLEDYEVLK